MMVLKVDSSDNDIEPGEITVIESTDGFGFGHVKNIKLLSELLFPD